MIEAATAFERWHKRLFGYDSSDKQTNEWNIRSHAYLSGFATASRRLREQRGGETIGVPPCPTHDKHGPCVQCFWAGYRAGQPPSHD